MGKDLRGKELGIGISQREDGWYLGRFTNKHGRRVQKLFQKIQECRQWLADSQYTDDHSNIDFPEEMSVNAWFEYWISIKKGQSNLTPSVIILNDIIVILSLLSVKRY